MSYDTAYNTGIKHGRELEYKAARAQVAQEIERLTQELAQVREQIKEAETECDVHALATRVQKERADKAEANQAVMVETLQGIANANWREWGEHASPDEFVAWAKSRATHAISLASPRAKQILAVEYQSSVSGMWYSNPEAAGDISAIKYNGTIYSALK